MAQNLINQLQSNAITYRNLGAPKVAFVPKKMRYVLLIPKGDTLSAAQFANLRATLEGKMADPDRSKRWQKTALIADMTFSGEGPKKETSGFGDTRMSSEGTVAYDLTFWEGGIETHKNMRALNGFADSKDVMFTDDKGRLVFNTIVGPNGAWMAGGFKPTDIFTEAAQFPTADNGFFTKTTFTFADVAQFSDTIGVYEPSFSISTAVQSLINIGLNNVSPAGATPGQITIAPMAGGENLAVTLNTTNGNPFTSGNGTLWQAFNDATGAAVTITAASYVPGVGIRLTLTVTGIAAGTVIAISLKDNVALAAAGLKGFDNNDTLYWVAP